MGRRTQLLVAAVSGLAGAHACIGWGVDIEEGCVVNSDCETGYVCVDGGCRKVCTTSADCLGSQECEEGVCVRVLGALCNNLGDCVEPRTCELLQGAECYEGECRYPVAAAGSECDDGDPCTLNDVCDDARACSGTARVCDAPPNDECTPDDLTFVSYPDIGTCLRPSGDCDYPSTETPCPNCAIDCLQQCVGVVCDDTQGGCSSNGVCVGGSPPVCSYEHTEDGTACDLDGDPVGSGNGVCDAGLCVGCTGPEHCVGPPGEVQCYDAACNGGTCEYIVRDGLGCDDGDQCTHTDLCDSAGACAGTSIVCGDGPSPCGVQRSCNGTSTCTEAWPGASTGCNDGVACTYDDHCDGSGGCTGSSITCTDDAGTCAANRSCNNTSSCAVSYPGTSTTCNDNQDCTYNDRCNGSGGCSGTIITCSDAAGVCGANRSCDGTSSCAVSYPGSGTGCNDNNPCTISDHCNGSGGCVGGGSAADGTLCGSSWQVCCGGTCTDLQYNANHCGGCGVNCAAQGLTCHLTTTGGYTCGTCSANSTCVAIYDSAATCWTSATGGNNLCQCQCPSDGVCNDGGCGTNMKCYDCALDNFCSPSGPGACP